MARSVQRLHEEIQALSRSEKEGLLRALVVDLDVPSDPAIDALWLEEARQRGQEIDEGRVQCVPAADVFKKLDSSLGKK